MIFFIACSSDITCYICNLIKTAGNIGLGYRDCFFWQVEVQIFTHTHAKYSGSFTQILNKLVWKSKLLQLYNDILKFTQNLQQKLWLFKPKISVNNHPFWRSSLPSLKSIRSKMSFVTATVCISRAVRSFEKWFAKRSFGSLCWKVSEEVGRGCEIFFGKIFRKKGGGG